MKTGTVMHGFEFTSEKYVPEISGTLRMAEHKKSGAALLFIDREDNNKTFSIAFKTIPEDDTGVFHIIEHSVLCGSDKYPVKEPFVDLLKGSLKTFLNAMTYPDKTVYPVSSRNDTDFLNLVSVYMDAVLHPRAVSDPKIFWQEGWHYELESPDSDMIYKGVVFNEMKGAYSSADEVEMEEMSSLIYKNSTYAKDSGGNPKAIPSLTYEQFVASHARYYHPSNARIILDGSVDLDKTLALLDSFLSEYDRTEADPEIPMVAPIGEVEKTIKYEIAPGENPEGKARICLGFMVGDYTERRTMAALGIIVDAIAASNESPFKKAMLASGLCEDAGFISYDGIQQNSIFLELKNVKEENLGAAKALALDTIRKIVDEGIDREALIASFNSVEFRLREQDMASFPQGLAFSLATLDSWLYGGDPAAPLSFEEDIAALRKAMETDYYERLLERVILDSRHKATLNMLPSATLGEQRAAEERELLRAAKAKMTDAEIAEVVKRTEELVEWQRREDAPEDVAKLPKLSLSDIETKPEPYPTESYILDTVPTLHVAAKTRGITYTTLLFDIADFSCEDIFYASLLTDVLKNLPTDKSDTVKLQTRVKSELGAFSSAVLVTSKNKKATPYMQVTVSALDSKLDSARELTEEILLHTVFADTDAIGKLVRQIKMAAQEMMAASGHTVAFARSAAYVSAEAAVSEYVDGLEYYFRIKELDANYESRCKEIAARLAEVAARIFCRGRLTVCYTGERRDETVSALIGVFPNSERVAAECKIAPLGIRNEGILIPAQISFASRAANALDYAEHLSGSFAVARTLLSYGYLWGAIRVQGGAYGAGFIRRNSGLIGFYTYRDPDAARSLGCFEGAADFLRQAADSGESLTNYIIGALGDSDPLITPKMLSAYAIGEYLRGESYEDRVRYRRELVETDRNALLAIADIVEKITVDGGLCVVGGMDKLDACGDKIKTILEI